MNGHCLVVDDDAEIRTSLAAYLQGFGWQVDAAADGGAMRQLLAQVKADVIVLDLMLPGEDGLALLRWLSTQPDAPPVLMLTARGDTMSRVIGLELGADDYLAKPFEPRELVARLQALVRRTSRGGALQDDTRMLRFGRWRFDRLARQLLSADDVGIALSSAEFRLLAAFVQRPGRVLGRDQLIEMTRAPGVKVNDRSIDLAVSRLRAKLGDTAREPALIRTVRGEGYLFDAEVVPC
ncbi:response regulator [Roseateles saccharophilus]|uniref:Winged helix family two component transcriptional regulator n=1 Tax=Roseateles saccharophilus TaxID=304 RepID=A0A4V2VR69_ROSSA|nr:response regulator transcription factor [Roseateles saccharophilus]MDG0832305.1 response regulator transcription factor [Roseateles saccharophilus]TCU96999.1 winged helix family two component transcriptional regulator [Roseateles saccharophilus]